MTAAMQCVTQRLLMLLFVASCAADAVCPAGTYGGASSAGCTVCPLWGKDTPAGSFKCTGKPRSGWIPGDNILSCDDVCSGDLRNDTTSCRIERMGKVTSVFAFRVAMASAVSDRGPEVDLLCPKYEASLYELAPGRVGGLCKVLRSPVTHANGEITYFTPLACATPVDGMLRLCCCTTDEEDAAAMCPVAAIDCAAGTEWRDKTNGGSMDIGSCVSCPPGTRGVKGTGLSQCDPCAAGRHESGTRTNASMCSGTCAVGTFSNATGVTSQSGCAKCSPGRFTAARGLLACEACAKGYFNSHAGASACDDKCPIGHFSSTNGASTCSRCPKGRFAATAGAIVCERCPVGRITTGDGAVVEANCTFIGGNCPSLDGVDGLLGNVVINGIASLIGESTQVAGPYKFGDQVTFRCKDGTKPQLGPLLASCTKNGTWEPDPCTGSPSPTQCLTQFCEDKELPPAALALVGTSADGLANSPKIFDLVAKAAPMSVALKCNALARVVLDGSIRDAGLSIPLSCSVNGTNTSLKWQVVDDAGGSANDPAQSEKAFDFARFRCQCGKGLKQGAGLQLADCVACLDGTYAPINQFLVRTECRACPRTGVSCNDGVLTIRPDYWYDAEVANRKNDVTGEKFGLGPATNMYVCAKRDACLLNTSVAPMTVKCHENHTGVMCARCYHRHIDCARGDNNGGTTCPEPGYFSRDAEWMFFASHARHCVRCPAGRDAAYNYVLTAALAVTFAVALVAVVVQRLMGAWKRVRGKHRSDASGIARVFFNWIQMVSMLQSIKLQPPEEVRDAMETAEVVNVSIEWFPIQCTLRLNFYARVLIYMTMPIFAVVVPLIYVYVMSICTPALRKLLAKKRLAKRAGKKLSPFMQFVMRIVELISGEKLADKSLKAKQEAKNGFHKEMFNEAGALHDEIEHLIDDLVYAESQLAELKRSSSGGRSDIARRVEAGVKDENRAVVDDTVASHSATPDTRDGSASAQSIVRRANAVMEVEGRVFYEVVSARAISLRAAPSCAAEKIGFVLQHGDVVCSNLLQFHGTIGFIKLHGDWGEGWVFDALPDGTQLLRKIDKADIVNADTTVKSHERDEILHCFLAICAISDVKASENESIHPVSIARESIEYVLPAARTKAENNKFFDGYDADGDGTISFHEFITMYPALRTQWRFENVWAEFQHIDSNADGVLGVEELRRLVPQGSSDKELAEWMAHFDRGEKGYITLSDFVAIDSAVQRDLVLLAVGTAFVLCTYFVYSRVTKALLSVFSMETIEGKRYLKFEMGTPALTLNHKLMMALCAVYLVLFSIVVPLVGLWSMFQIRHRVDDRRVGTMAGFLMDGYRVEVAWFWEFVVLARKLVILGVSLFIEEAFLQSFAAVVVLVVALSIQLYFHPFKLLALNVLEIMSIASVLATQLGSVLMWYKQLPGNELHSDYLRRGAVAMLFATNGVVIVCFVSVVVWYWLKEKSKDIVQWAPFLLPLFDEAARMEEMLRWPQGTPLLSSEKLAIRRDEWTYLASQHKGTLLGHGVAHGVRKNATKTLAKLATVAKKLGVPILEEEEMMHGSTAVREPETGALKHGVDDDSGFKASPFYTIDLALEHDDDDDDNEIRYFVCDVKDDQGSARPTQANALNPFINRFQSPRVVVPLPHLATVDQVSSSASPCHKKHRGIAASPKRSTKSAFEVIRPPAPGTRSSSSSIAADHALEFLPRSTLDSSLEVSPKAFPSLLALRGIGEEDEQQQVVLRRQRTPSQSDDCAWWRPFNIRVGMRIVHPLRGNGVIEAISEGGDERVHVRFTRAGDLHRYNEQSWAKFFSMHDMFTNALGFEDQGTGLSMETNPLSEAQAAGERLGRATATI